MMCGNAIVLASFQNKWLKGAYKNETNFDARVKIILLKQRRLKKRSRAVKQASIRPTALALPN